MMGRGWEARAAYLRAQERARAEARARELARFWFPALARQSWRAPLGAPLPEPPQDVPYPPVAVALARAEAALPDAPRESKPPATRAERVRERRRRDPPEWRW